MSQSNHMQLRAELDEINAAFSAAYTAGDVDAIAGAYAEDARLLLGGQPIVRGRSAIAAQFREGFRDGAVPTVFETGEILAGGDIVVDVGRFTTPAGTGKYVVVYQRGADGTLQIAVDAASGDGPRHTR